MTPKERAYACLPQAAIGDGKFALTTVQDAHIEPIRQWRNAQMDVLRQSAPIDPAQQVGYFASRIWPTLHEPQPRNILLGFLAEGRLVGYGGLVHVAWSDGRAELSFLLEPDIAADRAAYAEYFTAYLNLIKRLAFDSLGLHRLFTETYAFRSDHIAVLEGAGFVLEGTLRNHVRIGERPVNSLMHGCLSGDPR